MAASSSVPNSKVGEPIITSAVVNGSTTPQRLIDPPKNQRGQNKPRCIKCGNVARSRCPFQSCKNCCANAQNPCHIHVLKDSNILPAQPPPSTSPLPEQPSADVPSTGASWRMSSLKRLVATFANSMRVKKPLTRKDAVTVNKWRFLKLKEHIEGNIEAENEAFDRYLWNVGLLEETFCTEGIVSDSQTANESSDEKFQKLVSSMKLRLRSNSEKAEDYRERTRYIVNQLLRKLRERDVVFEGSLYVDDLDGCRGPKRLKKEGEWRAERIAAYNDLINKLSKARNGDDLKPCLEMKCQLLKQYSGSKVDDSSGEQDPGKPLVPKQESVAITDLSSYSLPKMCSVVSIDQEAFSDINAELSSVGQLAEL